MSRPSLSLSASLEIRNDLTSVAITNANVRARGSNGQSNDLVALANNLITLIQHVVVSSAVLKQFNSPAAERADVSDYLIQR